MDIVTNLRVAYRILEDRITTALRTQIGDCQRLSAAQDEVLTLRGAIEEVRCHQSGSDHHNACVNQNIAAIPAQGEILQWRVEPNSRKPQSNAASTG